MSLAIELKSIDVFANKDKQLLYNLSFDIAQGQFVAVLGESGAGKTSLLDLLMGFRRPAKGSITIGGLNASDDNWPQRASIAYLSEKVDIPGDWSVREFLSFNQHFFSNYDKASEARLLREFKVEPSARLGGMSAGEIRRAQIVAGLSANPKLIIIDEITAVLDIVGRRLLMRELARINKEHSTTVVLATNILEDLQNYISHILMMSAGKSSRAESLTEVLRGKASHEFSQVIADRLETT